MLMRNPEYHVGDSRESGRDSGELLADCTPREMLLGQIVLILLFVIAILLGAIN